MAFVIGISGPAGSGKTTFIRNYIEDAIKDGQSNLHAIGFRDALRREVAEFVGAIDPESREKAFADPPSEAMAWLIEGWYRFRLESDRHYWIRAWKEAVDAVTEGDPFILVDDVLTVREAQAILEWDGFSYLAFLDDEALTDEQVGAELLMIKKMASVYRVNSAEWYWATRNQLDVGITEALMPLAEDMFR